LGENFRILINTAVLDGRSWVVDELAMEAQPPGKEKNLRVKGPGAHIAIKVRQVGIFSHRLIKWLPAQALGKQTNQSDLPTPILPQPQ